jgi:hypothetical protein
MIYFSDGGKMCDNFFSVEMIVLAEFHAGSISFNQTKVLIHLEDEENQ